MRENGYQEFGTTDFLMLLTVLFWGLNFTFIKLAIREFPPAGFNGLRLLVASAILLFVLWRKREGFSLRKAEIVKVAGLGILGNTFYQTLFIKGITLDTATNVSLVMASTPVLIALLSSLIARERIHWAGWMGIVVSLFGLYLVITQRAGTFVWSWQNLKGDVLIFLANLCWALYTILSRPLLKKHPPLKLTTLTLAFGTLFYLPLTASGIRETAGKNLSLEAWGSLLYSSVFAISLSFVIWNASLKRVGNSKTGIYGNITPLFAVFFAHIFLSEELTLLQGLGALIIFFGFYLTRSGYRRFQKKPLRSDSSEFLSAGKMRF